MMVPNDLSQVSDVVFMVEATANCGAYIKEIRENYIKPTLEYFNGGLVDERDFGSKRNSTTYTLVTFFSSDCLPGLPVRCRGPVTSIHKFMAFLDNVDYSGGHGDGFSHIADGLACSLQCYEDLSKLRESQLITQKHCILICNSQPYQIPIQDIPAYVNLGVDQIATVLTERSVNLSILSPRKIPALLKLFDAAGGDLTSTQAKNYAKDPRHLVLLKGYSLTERPLSPTSLPSGQQPSAVAVPQQQPQQNQIPVQPQLSVQSQLPVVQAGLQQSANNSSPAAGPQMAQFRPSVAPMVGVVPRAQVSAAVTSTVPTPANMNQMNRFGQPGQNLRNPEPSAVTAAMLNRGAGPRWPGQSGQPMATATMSTPQMMSQPGQMSQAGMRQAVPTSSQSVLLTQLNMPPSSSNPALVGALSVQNSSGGVGAGSSSQFSAGPNMPNQPSMGNPGLGNSGLSSSGLGNPGVSGVPAEGPMKKSIIWQGLLEWMEKAKPGDTQKITRQVPCQLSCNAPNGEPEIKADNWPTKLMMHLIPKAIVSTLGSPYFKNSRSVLFHPQNCEALEHLSKSMGSGFAGCVYFGTQPNGPIDVKVLMLLFSPEKRAYVGFIPKDQNGFVDRIKKVMALQRSQQALRQGQLQGGPGNPAQLGMGVAQVGVNQLGGPRGSSPSGAPSVAPTMGIAQGGLPQGGSGSMLQTPGQGAPPPSSQSLLAGQLTQGRTSASAAPSQNQSDPTSMERQQNLIKIQQLQESLQAAQQKEMQYKAQNQQQQQQQQLRAQLHHQLTQRPMQPQSAAGQQQQQRMLGPGAMQPNPGLRHLLQQQQQQQQFRQQIIGGPNIASQMNAPQSHSQQQFDDVGILDLLNSNPP